MKFLVIAMVLCGWIAPFTYAQAEEPALPAGLGGSKEPKLPTGLGSGALKPSGATSGEPPLPGGLRSNDRSSDDKSNKIDLTSKSSDQNDQSTGSRTWLNRHGPFKISGFWEARGGTRLQDAGPERQTSIAETRFQWALEKTFQRAKFSLVSDFLYDNVADTQHINLNSGRGWIDLRSANVAFSPTSFIDIKAGRQILTWGTGDLLFINDLFPKDWNAFFIGRNEDYLKAPSDAVKTSIFSQWANLDIVVTPQFDADRFIDGRRLSYYVPQLGGIGGRDAIVHPNRPNDEEIALRLYRNISSYEIAAYFYHGHWKSPGGFNPLNGSALFPKLRVFGGSIRGPVGKGIGNIEVGHYDSFRDSKGTNPFINNSEFRLLAGYEQEVAKNLTLSGQYYLEHIVDYQNYRRVLPIGFPARNEDRHLLTTRITYLTHNQNAMWSLFTYYSPSDQDFYLRPKVSYRIDDHWTAELGGNIFGGNKSYTFFSQFHNNTNIYASIRYGF